MQCLWRTDEDCASRVIAGMPDHSIKDPFVIGKILSQLETRWLSQGPENRRPGAFAIRMKGISHAFEQTTHRFGTDMNIKLAIEKGDQDSVNLFCPHPQDSTAVSGRLYPSEYLFHVAEIKHRNDAVG